jgi:hypothetical protein
MIHMSQRNDHAPRRVRSFMVAVAAVVVLLNMQGCATSLETFGLGAGVGIVGAFSLLGCAIGCH